MNQKIKPTREKLPSTIRPYFQRWQSNNSKNDLGIVRFIFDLHHLSLQRGYKPPIRDFNPKYGVAPWASEALAEYFVYYPGMPKEERSYVYATYREGSKTFWFAFALPLYEILVGQYGIYYKDNMFFRVDYHVIKCKNKTEAEKRLLSISSILNRPIIKDLFGDLKPTFHEQKSKDAKDTNALLILSNGSIIQASGIDQPIRGANIMQVRPKSIIFDDPQNRENVKTPDRRAECDREVMEEAFGALAVQGSLIYIGNKVHEDDTLGKLLDQNNKVWHKQFHTLTYAIDENGKKIPGVGNLDKEFPEWPARYPISLVKKRRAWYESQPRLGGLRGFLKEYYNIIKSNQDYVILYHNAKYFHKFGINWLEFETPNGKKIVNCSIVIANDPAISESKKSSDAVISVVAKTPDGKRYLLEYAKGKFDIHDRYFDYTKKPTVLAVTTDELSNVKRYGSVDIIGRLTLKYHPQAVVVEVYGQQYAFYNETKELLEKLGLIHIPIIPATGKKESKIESIRQLPLIFFEKGDYYIREDMTSLVNEISAFPDTKLDTLDSLFLAEQFLISETVEPIHFDPRGFFAKEETSGDRIVYDNGNPEVEPWIIY